MERALKMKIIHNMDKSLDAAFLAMSKYLDKELIMDELYNAIKKYKQNKTQDNLNQVILHNTILSANQVMDNKTVEQMSTDLDSYRLVKERFKASN